MGFLRSTAFWTLPVVAVFLSIDEALAFKPDEQGHLGITSEALADPRAMKSLPGRVLKFTPKAITEIRNANEATDVGPGGVLFTPGDFVANQLTPGLHFDDEAFEDASSRLVELKRRIIANLKSAAPDGARARADLGKAFHTLQDYYSHTNWVELGNNGIDTRLGVSVFSGGGGRVSIDGVTLTPGNRSLTSGYFAAPILNALAARQAGASLTEAAAISCAPPAGKIRHGVPLLCPSGLNKDSLAGGAALGTIGTARRLAVDASAVFVQQILVALGDDERAISALMGLGGTLAVVIDDTGSMGEEIDAVKAAVSKLVADVRGTPNEPSSYVVVRFGDPDVGPARVTMDPDEFLAAVNALSPGGGGDCPELSLTAILQAMQASQRGARIVVFTDASAKDASLRGSVIALAAQRNAAVRFALTGSCSPIDPVYEEIARATGGQVFLFDQSQTGMLIDLIAPQVTGDLVDVTAVTGTLSGGVPREIVVPLDSTITRAIFSVSIDTKTSVTVRRPSGDALKMGDSGVTISDLTNGAIVTVTGPEPGIWKLEIAGDGGFSASVQANSPIDLEGFGFVTPGGRPGHEGLPAIAGQPIAGLEQQGLATLNGPVATADFRLVDEAGDTIQLLALARDPTRGENEFLGRFNLPTQMFRVAVGGLDSTGKAYARLLPIGFQGQTVEVTTTSAPTSVLAGSSATLRFQVRNLAPDAATFAVVASDTSGFIARVEPGMLTIAEGSTAAVEVDVAVPAGTTEETSDTVIVNVAKVGDPGVANSATAILPVVNRIETGSAVLFAFDGVDGGTVGENVRTATVLDAALGSLGSDEAVDVTAVEVTITSALLLRSADELNLYVDANGDGRIDDETSPAATISGDDFNAGGRQSFVKGGAPLFRVPLGGGVRFLMAVVRKDRAMAAAGGSIAPALPRALAPAHMASTLAAAILAIALLALRRRLVGLKEPWLRRGLVGACAMGIVATCIVVGLAGCEQQSSSDGGAGSSSPRRGGGADSVTVELRADGVEAVGAASGEPADVSGMDVETTTVFLK